MEKVFFDFEFTGLRQNTTPISIGMVTEDNQYFYGEFTDYDKLQIDPWIKDNVIKNLSDIPAVPEEDLMTASGRRVGIKDSMRIFFEFNGLSQKGIEFYGDCLSYDWVLFCELFGGALYLPKYIYYIPFDISTMFKMKGVDPDISREEFAGFRKEESKHNALFDAMIIKKCYERLMKIL